MTAIQKAYSVERIAFSLKLQRNSFFYLLLSFLLFSLLFLILFIPKSFAQNSSTNSATVPYSQTPPSTLNAIPYQSPHTASLAIYNFSHAMSCILIGQSPIAPCLEYKFIKNAQGMVQSVPYLNSTNTSNGVLGMSLSMIGEVISTPPIRSSEFIANLGEQIGVKSAHAQVGGSGSGVLSPIFNLWLVSRNISYLFMIVIFIVVGFMVMFRQRLNPQTVVSIQMALPSLVIGLVAITFSYFLASLISDVAFVGTNVVGYYFSLADPSITKPTQLPLINKKTNKEDNALSIFSRYTNILNQGLLYGAVDSVWDDLADPRHLWEGGPAIDAQSTLRAFSALIITQFFLPIGSLFGGWTTFWTATGTIGTGLLAPVFTVSWSLSFITLIILVYSMFRLLLRLIQSFLHIIFLTIAAPFYFLAVSLPGRQSLLPNWFFNMLCNVLAFPAVFAVFYFVAFILGRSDDPLFIVNGTATISGSSTFPLLGGMKLDFLRALLAFGALVAAPSIPDIICRTVGRPGQLGALAAGAVGGAIAAGQRYQGQIAGTPGYAAQNIGRVTDTPAYELTSSGWRKFTETEYGKPSPTPGLLSRIKANLTTSSTGGSGKGPNAQP